MPFTLRIRIIGELIMKQIEVRILPLTENQFLTTFEHPLTKKKVRQKFLTRKEAQEYKVEIEHQFKRGKVKNYRELTIEELLCLFMEDCPESPFSKKKVHLIDFVDTFGELLLDDLTTPMLRSWLNQIKIENNLQEISVRGLKCEVDTFFAYLVKKEIISESPLKRIYYKKYVPSIKARNILSPDEINDLLRAIKAYSPGYLYPIVKMFAETACKTSELVHLEWSDVNLSKKIIKLKGQNKGQERKVHLSDELIALLSKKEKMSGRVFMTYYKEPFTSKKVILAINEFKLKTRYSLKWCPMDLRHSFAVNYLSKGGDIRELQMILGHYNVFETKRLYGEAMVKNIAENSVSPY